ncbi:iron chelate uptake ABC transporter family permease subunit [Hoyosella sp. G463]|uniref:Iron chelate uptake ABC transporter family permease subunit n=1 Tax=Lolliginicoccus lacisalsi TaxID=2742202 RepID=A0A927JD46_9ACTN|nr:iron chelate uptake ABC transporter family permease subunit [Lolliginicoccus lacisalsi]
MLPARATVLRRGSTSLLVDRRGTTIGVLALLLALGLAAWSLGLGELRFTSEDIGRILLGGGTLIEHDVVVGTRLPRAIVAVLVGAALGASGQVLQRIAANPLASPDVLGISTGASLGALVSLLLIGGSAVVTMVGALAGAAIASVLVIGIAHRQGASGYRIILVGIGVGALGSSLIALILTRAESYAAHSAAIWLTGSLSNRGWTHVQVIAVALLVGVPALAVLSRHLPVLELGDDLAQILAGRAAALRIGLVAVACGLAALATAAAGPIAFVALVAPQISRLLLGGRTGGPFLSAGIGAVLVISADLAAKHLFPVELPVGILTACLGAPVLLVLLARAARKGSA